MSRLLVWLKAHLAPLYSWRAAVNESSVARMPDTVILTLEYLDLTLRDMSFKVAAARTTKREGVAFRTDAKCADGYVVLGGWDCSGTTQESRWFSLRLSIPRATASGLRHQLSCWLRLLRCKSSGILTPVRSDA